MDGKKLSFFKHFRKLAAHVDRGKNLCESLCTNGELDYQSQTTCINALKKYAEELQEQLVDARQIYEEQEVSFVKFQSFLDLAEDVIDQQNAIVQSQETFMEQYGYVPYEKSNSEIKQTDDGTQDLETTTSTIEKNGSPEKMSEEVCADGESPETPKLEDFGLSHYTMLQLQKPKIYLNRPVTECIATPTVFQHDGLLMSPSVWGKMPSLYTPDLKNTTQETVGWPEFVASSAKKSAFQFNISRRIRKNLQTELDNDDDILNQLPSVPSLNTVNQQNFNLDIYQLPPTPKSASKLAILKPPGSAFSKPKDYFTEEVPLPPKLNLKIQLRSSHSSINNKPMTPLEAPLPSRYVKSNLDTPSPPVLHTTLSKFDTLLSPDIIPEPVLSCKSKKKDKISYFEKDIPEPPEVTGIYRYSTRNKENRLAKTKLF